MLRALYAASSGMLAQQTNMDIMANNLANVNTNGFKKSRADFGDLLYSTVRGKNRTTVRNEIIPNEIQTGNGVRVTATKNTFSDGSPQVTGNSLDVAITGDGFLQIQMPDGTTAYTRNGALQTDSTGAIVTSDGYYLKPAITIPQGAKDLSIAANGTVSALLPGKDTPEVLGQIQLAKFINPAGLGKTGSSLFYATANSGQAQLGFGNDPGFGIIKQGFLEMSNVNVAEEMVNIMVAQRAYELNSKALKNCDDMLGIANGLLRR